MPRSRPEITCPPEHAHGENSTCRSLHGCICDDCRDFAAQYEFWRAAQIRAGRPLLIETVGIHRRIRALQRIGYSQKAIADLCGRSEPWVGNVMRSAKVSRATADLITRLYETHSMTVPVGETKDQRAGITRTRRYAERNEFPPPLAWDDETIDDPSAQPAGVARPLAPEMFLTRRDEEVVDAALRGEQPRMSPVEREDVVTALHERHWSARRVAEWIGCNPKTVERVRIRLKLPRIDPQEMKDAA